MNSSSSPAPAGSLSEPETRRIARFDAGVNHPGPALPAGRQARGFPAKLAFNDFGYDCFCGGNVRVGWTTTPLGVMAHERAEAAPLRSERHRVAQLALDPAHIALLPIHRLLQPSPTFDYAVKHRIFQNQPIFWTF